MEVTSLSAWRKLPYTDNWTMDPDQVISNENLPGTLKEGTKGKERKLDIVMHPSFECETKKIINGLQKRLDGIVSSLTRHLVTSEELGDYESKIDELKSDILGCFVRSPMFNRDPREITEKKCVLKTIEEWQKKIAEFKEALLDVTGPLRERLASKTEVDDYDEKIKTIKTNLFRSFSIAPIDIIVYPFTTNSQKRPNDDEIPEPKRPRVSPSTNSASSSTMTDDSYELLRASREGNVEEIIRILERGVNPNVTNNSGTTALITATSHGHQMVVAELLKRGAKVDRVNSDGDSALHVAARLNRKKILLILIGSGAAISVKNDSGHTAQEVATQNGNGDIAANLRLHTGTEEIRNILDEIRKLFADMCLFFNAENINIIQSSTNVSTSGPTTVTNTQLASSNNNIGKDSGKQIFKCTLQ